MTGRRQLMNPNLEGASDCQSNRKVKRQMLFLNTDDINNDAGDGFM